MKQVALLLIGLFSILNVSGKKKVAGYYEKGGERYEVTFNVPTVYRQQKVN